MSGTTSDFPISQGETVSSARDVANDRGQQFVGNTINNSHITYQSSQGPQRPENVWMFPRKVNSLFTGRSCELQRLETTFAPRIEDNEVASSQRVCVIAGLAGTGKSELCLNYAWNARQRYWGVFWIDCTNADTAKESFKQLGQLCKYSDTSVEAVRYELANNRKLEYLMILDNADDPTKCYLDYIPVGETGDIILTSRDKDLIKDYGTSGGFELDQLPLDFATNLLLNAAKIPRTQWNEKRTDEEAKRIVQRLGNHTLALIHAGSFIGEKYCKLEEYLTFYSQKADHLFQYECSRAQSTYKTVFTTFEVSIQRMREMQSFQHRQEAEDALDLLDLLALMPNRYGIGKILSTANDYYRIRLHADESFPDLSKDHFDQLPPYCRAPWIQMSNSSSNDGILRWWRACKLLQALSLISIQENNRDMLLSRLSLHKLVHDWAWARLASGGVESKNRSQVQVWYRAASLIGVVCKGDAISGSATSYTTEAIRPCLKIYKTFSTRDISTIGVRKTFPLILWLSLGLMRFYPLQNPDRYINFVKESCEQYIKSNLIKENELKIIRLVILFFESGFRSFDPRPPPGLIATLDACVLLAKSLLTEKCQSSVDAVNIPGEDVLVACMQMVVHRYNSINEPQKALATSEMLVEICPVGPVDEQALLKGVEARVLRALSLLNNRRLDESIKEVDSLVCDIEASISNEHELTALARSSLGMFLATDQWDDDTNQLRETIINRIASETRKQVLLGLISIVGSCMQRRDAEKMMSMIDTVIEMALGGGYCEPNGDIPAVFEDLLPKITEDRRNLEQDVEDASEDAAEDAAEAAEDRSESSSE